MKKPAFILIAAVFSFIISCSLSSPLPGILGDEVRVDKETGFFKEDMEYTYNAGTQYYTYTFTATGAYTYNLFSWNAAEGEWEQDAGVKGSYIYNPDNMILSLLITEEYDVSSGEWTAPVWTPYIKSWHAYFTTVNWYGRGRVFPADQEKENSWSYTYSYEDAEKEIFTETTVITMVPEPEGSFSELISSINSNTTGEWDKDEVQTAGTVMALYPAGTKFRKGETVTFSVTAEKTIRDWDPDTGWDEWSVPAEERQSRTYLHMGDFLIYSPSLAAGRWVP